jgi:hypothetical protein
MVAHTTMILRGLRTHIGEWRTILKQQRQLLDSQDLNEYFAFYNNERAFNLRDEAIRGSVLRGETYMVAKNGRVIFCIEEVKTIMTDYPDHLIRQQVKTVAVPEYEGFDSRGRMINKRSHRCCVATISHEEMLLLCHERNQFIPIDIQERRLKLHSVRNRQVSSADIEEIESRSKRPRL